MSGPVLLTMVLMLPYATGQVTQNCTDCDTKQCISVSEGVLYGIDESVDPCDDFYKYACGGWLNRQFLTTERQRIYIKDEEVPLGTIKSLLTESIKQGELFAVIKAKSLYDSCYNFDTGARSRQFLDIILRDMGVGWVFGCDFCIAPDFNMEDFLFQATILQVNPLFTLSTRGSHVGPQDGTWYRRPNLFISEPTLQVSLEDYAYLRNEPKLIEVYADMMCATLKHWFRLTIGDLARVDAMAVVEAEIQIASIINSSLERETTTRSSLNLVNQNYGQLLNWTRFVNRIAAMEEIGIHIAFDETFYIRMPTGLNETINFFLQLPRRTQLNYLLWRAVDFFVSVLDRPEDKLNNIILHHFHKPTDNEYKVEPCITFLLNEFPMAVHRMLYAKHLQLDKIRKVASILQQMQNELTSLLAAHNWLDHAARQAIEDKFVTINGTLDYFRVLTNDTFLDSAFRNVHISLITHPVRGNFLQDVSRLRKNGFVHTFRTIRAPDRRVAITVGIFQKWWGYNYTFFIPLIDAMQYPWFLDNAPMVLNYAGLGFIIAHRLIHSFPIKGIKVHGNRTEGAWLGNAAAAEFDARVRCLTNQYSQYWYKSARSHVNGSLTIGENIADNAALKLAYKAYQNYVNTTTTREMILTLSGFIDKNKLFFVRAAQMWCMKETFEKAKEIIKGPFSPTEFRVNGALQNSMEFAEAFHCRSGSPMNPVNKCEVV